MRDGDTNVLGGLFFLITNSRKGMGQSGYAILNISFYLFFCCLFFFTYSEALPALRLRRDDFGPPVGSALNNP